MTRMGYKIISISLILAGLLLIVDSQTGLTGAVLGFAVTNNTAKTLTGLVLLLLGAILFMVENSELEKKIRLTSSIKKYKSICKLAEDATRNQDVQREIDHLVYELSKGHLAGLPHIGYIEKTDVFYLRGRRGGRLYYRRTKEGYDIVGKSAKGKNQDQVIKQLEEKYHSS